MSGTMRSRARQRGAVMIMSLVMLVTVTLIAIFSAQGALLGERMAGNERDRIIALQAAEAALRDADDALPLLVGATPDCETLFSANCANGLCTTGAAVPAAPVWTGREDLGIRYGNVTGKDPLLFNGKSPQRQPRFLVEWMVRDVQINGVRPVDGETRRGLFRIYAWGYGLRPGTQVLLESLISHPNNYCSGL
jgi:type IV pilus assembly protein PilX